MDLCLQLAPAYSNPAKSTNPFDISSDTTPLQAPPVWIKQLLHNFFTDLFPLLFALLNNMNYSTDCNFTVLHAFFFSYYSSIDSTPYEKNVDKKVN